MSEPYPLGPFHAAPPRPAGPDLADVTVAAREAFAHFAPAIAARFAANMAALAGPAREPVDVAVTRLAEP